MAAIPDELRWLFWNADFEALDCDAHADGVLARVVEHGDLVAVRWALGHFGPERIHRFFRDVGHPELSMRTLAFWRAFFDAEDEEWAQAPPWRRTSGVSWPG